MKLTDKAWKLGSHYGVIESTVADCTRGDSRCDEFFVTESEAWAAEAARANSELWRAQQEVQRLERRASEAKAKSVATATFLDEGKP